MRYWQAALVQQFANRTAVIAAVVDHVQEHFGAAHARRLAIHIGAVRGLLAESGMHLQQAVEQFTIAPNAAY